MFDGLELSGFRKTWYSGLVNPNVSFIRVVIPASAEAVAQAAVQGAVIVVGTVA